LSFEKLLKNDFIMLDGAMGTMIQKSGLEPGTLPELLGITNPELIVDIHKKYIDAGAQIIYANTFGANRFKLEGASYSVREVIGAAVKNAKVAAEGKDVYVALDLGPTGKLMAPSGELSFDDAYNTYKEQIEAGFDADIIVIETMTDLSELRAALLAAKENSTKPVMCTMTFEENLRTFSGCSVSSFAIVAEGLGADAIGINCSLGPAQLLKVTEELVKFTTLPIIIKPNAGLPNPIDNTYDITSDEFAQTMGKYASLGVKFFGGCCGTNPEYIKKTKKVLSSAEFNKAAKMETIPVVCSAAKTVLIDSPRVIGERINPTGKKKFRQALIENDIGYILNQAIEQEAAGAEILDVNVGLPEIDEKAMIIRLVTALSAVTTLPLQIDSTNPEVVEAALRIYPGKAIVNSVNGEEKSIREILPVVKKYGACVVALTLDENGIPSTAEERVEIAERILNAAMDMGIKKEDVFIDCLTLTVSAEQEAAKVTLEALSRVKNRLGLKTVLGVSNISFGLPARELVNSTFLTMALSSGLDLPIINPNAMAMMGAVRAYRVLNGTDKNSEAYVKAYADAVITMGQTANVKTEQKREEKKDIKYCVRSGLCEESARLTKEALKTEEAINIVNNSLIPALDEVGADFETNKIFLPQLILSANAAQSAFEVIKEHMEAMGKKSVSKGSIILATVKGDIHDIGKNIVKVLLENYGYDVIDLGRDVDPELIANTAKEKNIMLVGLSALMTTTLPSMEETIKKLRKSHDCKVLVGGAVLTEEYAKKIGADFYAKDAKTAVDVAKEVFK